MYKGTADLSHQKLKQPGREFVWAYLSSRGVTSADVDMWQLGFAVPSDDLSRGLWHRVTIPVQSLHGQVLSVSGRAIPGYATEYPDPYWHIPFRKSSVLFGLHQAVDYIVGRGYAILVEGQFDVISMHRSGYQNTVGCLGIELDHAGQQARLLTRYTERVLILPDPGPKAWEKAKGSARTLARNFVQAALPQNALWFDPDEACRRQPGAIRVAVQHFEKAVAPSILESKWRRQHDS